MRPKLLDLFSGIGGFSLGLERVGFKTVAFCETDRYCKEVLQKNWKGIKIYNDVKKIKGEEIVKEFGAIDIITGGFPCQSFSVAGRRKGTDDNRYLWPDMFRVIKEIKPRWVIGENVRGIINIQDGMVFETVCTDLESEGYETQTFIIPAAGVGAPHRRERVWIVGYSKHNGSSTSEIERRNFEVDERSSQGKDTAGQFKRTSKPSDSEDVANSGRTSRREQSSRHQESIGSGTSEKTEWSTNSDSITRSSEREKIMADSSSIQSRKPSESKGWEDSSGGSIDSRGDKNKRTEIMANSSSGRRSSQEKEIQTGGNSSQHQGWWDIEPDVGRVAHGVSGRVHRLKGLGNSIVPQIAEEIGKAIMKVEKDE